ncbi:MAG: hypothetical protein WAU44_19455 [Nitrospira sp.]|jgi:hypothetical protein|uniref:hypothetical protein n=1 Tax=Nitrospira sp. ND1 TaxID=1658518 RepID=UPI0009BA6441|nr:hypothetical protein [Nitrospira sp. ND1]MBK7417897.1 hypothetical protein [Nitrospira sp.]MBK7485105.1 hypothetical protein [Nitrospira sp.]MBK8377100.1 hypothetical protein [Nitrospira sp.]MBP6204527.1 hypothetical protein [Nitrospira sp.]MBP7361030.1 hypothetical protein [Nitrospira sp.]
MRLNLEQAFPTEQALRDMIVTRKVCFDHDPFYVKTGAGNVVQIGFQLNLYAAFHDPTQLPLNDDAEHREILGDLQRLCRVFFQTLDLLKPCEHPQPPAHRIVFSPERKNRAEVCLQIPIFDLANYADSSAHQVQDLLATAECLLTHVGARRRVWDEEGRKPKSSTAGCEGRTAADGS